MFTLKELCSLFRIRKSYSQNMKAFVPSDGTDILERCLLRCKKIFALKYLDRSARTSVK